MYLVCELLSTEVNGEQLSLEKNVQSMILSLSHDPKGSWDIKLGRHLRVGRFVSQSQTLYLVRAICSIPNYKRRIKYDHVDVQYDEILTL